MFEQQLYNSLIDNFNSNCVYINTEAYTYKQLAGFVAHAQKSLGEHCKPGDYVGIVMHNDMSTYASIIGVLLAGYAYVVINPNLPFERNRHILDNTDVAIVLSSTDELRGLAQIINKPYVLNNSELDESRKLEIVLHKRNPEDPAYALFTSGSTGIPKGVLISTGNVDAFLDSFFHLGIDILATDKVLQMFDLTFDVSVAMILIPLIKGACIYPVAAGEIKYLAAFKLAIEHELTVLCMVPSMLAYLRKYFMELNLPHVKHCILTAEASTYRLLSEWSHCIPKSSIWNLYGPTEATIWSLAYRWNESDSEELTYHSMIPIGKALKNVGVSIRDIDGFKIDTSNVKGELLLSGPQVSPGYIGDQKTTQTSFVRFDISENVVYRTGDLVYINECGDIQYCGRIDHQVQIQGFRVELSEIEHFSRDFSKTSNVLAVAKTNAAGIQIIVLFIEDSSTSEDRLMGHLKKHLPYYMIPAKLIFLERFPLNSSSKIDRRKLEALIDA